MHSHQFGLASVGNDAVKHANHCVSYCRQPGNFILLFRRSPWLAVGRVKSFVRGEQLPFKQSILSPTSTTSPTTPTHAFTGAHGQNKARGGRGAVSACFYFQHWHAGTFWLSVNQNDTLLRVLGDKSKLILHISQSINPLGSGLFSCFSPRTCPKICLPGQRKSSTSAGWSLYGWQTSSSCRSRSISADACSAFGNYLYR